MLNAAFDCAWRWFCRKSGQMEKKAASLARDLQESLDGAPSAAYNKSAVRARLRLKVDARRGRNDPRKPAKVR